MKMNPPRKKFLFCTLLAGSLYLISIRTNMFYMKKPQQNMLIVNGNFTEEEVQRLEAGCTDQQDARLLQRLRTHWIHPPAAGPVHLHNPHSADYSQHQQSAMVDRLLHHKTDGFFVECGAGDGEFFSNSLFFERRRNWTGILIEATPSEYRKLVQKRRHSFSINACLNTVNSTGRYTYNPQPGHGGLLHEMKLSHRHQLRHPQDAITVQCFTLYSILQALGRSRVDFLSLDVEGAELGVLKTIPFQKLDIDVLLIEYLVMGSVKQTRRRYRDIREFLESRGYRRVARTKVDLLFIKKDINK